MRLAKFTFPELYCKNASEAPAVPLTVAVSGLVDQLETCLGKGGNYCVRKITNKGDHCERLGIAEGRESRSKMNQHESAVDGQHQSHSALRHRQMRGAIKDVSCKTTYREFREQERRVTCL